jgi:hypothetical protein
MGIGTSPGPEAITLEIWKETKTFIGPTFPNATDAIKAYIELYITILKSVLDQMSGM